ncbi:acetyltransferase [Polaribacter litorisediminis]|uniref:acetyltransferase n=1 Tax=Polaribacter litorisediminis TaxID=1908341 RepID=UPI001CBC9948|nr:acetyltransferase [Polaribacter litorisediminis]UAM96585.1 acetyltransferase [Polaribacter litorisediminis]
MKKIILIGCGSHAAELVDYIEYINKNLEKKEYHIKGLIDDVAEQHTHYNYSYAFLGKISDHQVDPEVYYLMGIGTITTRIKIFDQFTLKGAKFTGMIHPSALISDSAVIGEGTVISHNASVGPKAVIGAFNVINSRCTIGHDVTIGDHNFLSPQVVLGGAAAIGNSNLLGTNSCVLPAIKIGNDNKIMAGMVITNRVHDNETVFFRYKEKLIVRKE